MYKFTYQVLDFNTEEDRFVLLIKTTDARVKKQEEIVYIDWEEDQFEESEFKERLHKTVQNQLWPKWKRQNRVNKSSPVGTESFIGKSFESEYDYATNKIWKEPTSFSSIDDPWEELISEADIE